MRLPDLQRQLEAKFAQLAEERVANRRIFALEHGLPIDMVGLAGELANQLRYGAPNNAYWLAWIVFATEVGYDYAGDEYWQTFRERLPAWREIDTNNSRSHIRVWFRRFANTYNGVRPSGTWARQFRIIAWPITHAILPRDLQYQFAKSLHYNRYQIAADNDPLAIGRVIHHRTVHASSRFKEFCQQEELVGRIALALLGMDTEEVPLSHDTTRRIVGDLETTQAAREWLKEACADIRRIRGMRKQRPNGQPASRVPAIQPRFNLRPTLLLSQENGAWRIGIQVPSFTTLAVAEPEVAKYLQKTKVQFQGGRGEWQPARVLTIPSKLHRLERWPVDGVVLRFRDAFPSFEQLVRQETSLSGGPLWVCRIGNDLLAREVHSRQLRPGQRYVVLAREGHVFRPHQAIKPVTVRCEGLTGIELSLPEHVSDDLRHVVTALGLSFTGTIRVWPAGLPAVSWDGEGHTEWLSTDSPCFGIAVDHDVAALDVMLADLATLTIPRVGVQGPSWVQLPSLSPGQYRLVVEVKDDVSRRESSVASRGELVLEVRDPIPLEETIHQRGGLMVVTSPVSATLESFERNELRLEVFGPTGREAQLFLKFDDCESDQKPFRKVALPVVLTDLWSRLPTEVQEDLGGKSTCRLVVDADEIGIFMLSLERESRPVRWLHRRTKSAYTIRLIDEAGSGSKVQCHMAPLDRPTVAKPLEYDACVDGLQVESPGAIFVVVGHEQLDAVIVSQPDHESLHGFAKLAPAPQLDGFASSSECVSKDVALLTLWSRARVVGPLGATRQSKVVRSMRDALTQLVCGEGWMRAEYVFESSGRNPESIAVLGDAISTRRVWQNFPAKLRMSHHEVFDAAPAQVLPWLLAITTGFHLCTDTHLVERALRYFTDIGGFVASSGNVSADIKSLADHGELVRGVRYLQILLENKAWDWA